MPQQSYGNKKPFLILDTNIIIYQSQTWTEKQLGKELANLEATYTLSISNNPI